MKELLPNLVNGDMSLPEKLQGEELSKCKQRLTLKEKTMKNTLPRMKDTLS